MFHPLDACTPLAWTGETDFNNHGYNQIREYIPSRFLLCLSISVDIIFLVFYPVLRMSEYHPNAAVVAALAVEPQDPNTVNTAPAEQQDVNAATPENVSSLNAAPSAAAEQPQQHHQRERSISLERPPISSAEPLLPNPPDQAEPPGPANDADNITASSHGSEKTTRRLTNSIKGLASGVNRYWQDSWAAELVSSIVALAALAGMVGTLASHQGRPMPKWREGITLNTLVAVFSAVLKSALIMPVAEGISQLKWLWFRKSRALIDLEDFDAASRGPWGSFLFMIQPRKHYLATFGAFITVAALAVDPFSQQILQYENCFQQMPGAVARIPLSNNYTNAWIYNGPLGGPLKAPMSAAIFSGMLSPPPNTSSVLSVQCQTGNCTFSADAGASYMTLSMCSSCKDITSLIINNTGPDKVMNFSLPGLAGEKDLSIGTGTMLSSQTTEMGDDSALFAFQSLMFSTSPLCDSPTTPGCEQDALAGHGSDKLRPWAVQCSLVPCVKTYAANISISVLSEKLISTSPLTWDAGISSRKPRFSLITDFTMRDGVRHNCVPSKERTDNTPIGVYENNTLAGPDAAKWYSADCFWYMDPYTSLAISEFLIPSYDKRTLSIGSSGVFSPMGPLWLMSLYHDTLSNLTTANRYMEGLADAMSAEIRQGGFGSPANGTVMESQTCIRVQWAWISLPAILVVLSVLFFATTWWCSQMQSWRGMWKSSSLALLLASFESETLLQEGPLERNSQRTEKASKIRARFTQINGGWGFVETPK